MNEPTRDLGEVEELRAEIARLRAELPQQTAATSGGRAGWWRPWVVTVLVIVMAVLAPLGVVARWADSEISDTDRYVESVAPLASDPAVQAAVTDKITDEITARLQVEAVTDEAIGALTDRGLPPLAATSLEALGGPLASAIEGFIHKEVAALVASDAFQTAWEAANREAHTQMVAVLTGKDTDLVEISNNSVSVNLATVIDSVKQRLVERGFDLAERLPTVQAEFTIFQSDDITKAQSAFRLLGAVSTLLPILILVLLAVALGVARARRRTLIAAMLAIAGSMLLLGVALNAFRMIYLDAVSVEELPVEAAAAVYDTLVWFIRLNLRAILVLTLAVAAIAWISGPGSTAVTLRSGVSRGLGHVRSGGDRIGIDTGRFGEFLGTYRVAIRGAVLAIALLVYVMADYPTGAFTITVLAVAAVVLLIIELLARPPVPAVETDAPAPPPPST
ncbi:MAG: hypothetical protein WBP61_11150 [Nocardioides sp.]